jgi:hypothetical protein
MGVDFRMQAVRPLPQGRFEPIVGDAPDTPPAPHLWYGLSRGGGEFWTRLPFLEALFRPRHQPDTPAELLRSLSPPEVSFRWFEACYMGAYRDFPPATVQECFEPREVVECLENVLDLLRRQTAAFPPRYTFRGEGTHDNRGGLTGVYEGRLYAIRGGWGRCEATPEPQLRAAVPAGDRTIDLRSHPSIQCREVGLVEVLPDRPVSPRGPETVFQIVTETCLDVYGPSLKAMRGVASKAEADHGLVFTYLS